MKQFLTLLFILVGVLFADVTHGDAKAWPSWEAKREHVTYIYSTRPRRLDEPLRETNISDEEVREVQAVTEQEYPGAIANISGVVDRCPCEDGPQCDSQVWILAYRDGDYNGLLLSRIDGKWIVGPIQEWWQQHDIIRGKIRDVLASKTPDRHETYMKLLENLSAHQDAFPSCTQ